MKEGKKVQVNFSIDENILALIDSYSKTLGLTRPQMIRNFLVCGLSDAKVLKVTGLLDIVGAIRSLEKKPEKLVLLRGF